MNTALLNEPDAAVSSETRPAAATPLSERLRLAAGIMRGFSERTHLHCARFRNAIVLPLDFVRALKRADFERAETCLERRFDSLWQELLENDPDRLIRERRVGQAQSLVFDSLKEFDEILQAFALIDPEEAERIRGLTTR